MKKITLLTMLVLLAAPQLQAAETDCKDAVNIKVNGLVCDFCARSLEKLFGKREEVSSINVDLDKGNVAVNMKPGQSIDDATLKKLITDSGYNVQTIKRGC